MKQEAREAPKMLDMRVASFTHWLQGPAAAQYLADMGADVIKVEAPGGGHERRWAAGGRTVDGIGTLLLAANRNSRSVVIDLKSDEGRRVALALLAKCDVLIENFRPGVMDRLSLGYEDVRKVRPDIIYASATGYGADGPLAKAPGQDLLVQARTGIIAQSGEKPTAIGTSAVDQHGGTLLALGILGAFIRRTRTGEGTRVEGSLYNSSLDLMQEGLVHYYAGGQDRPVLKRSPNLSTWYMDAPYGIYRLLNGAVVVSMNTFARLHEALGDQRLEAVIDLDPWKDRERCAAALAAVLAEKTLEQVSACFDPMGIWYERVCDVEDLRSDPQAAHANVFMEAEVGDRVVTLINHPIRYDRGTPGLRALPLLPGEHTCAVLDEIGMDEAEVTRLLNAGIVRDGREEGQAE